LPNGNPAPGPKFVYKLQWMDRLNQHAAMLLAGEQPIVLGGDFNVIPDDLDCYDPLGWEGDALTRPETRQAFRTLAHTGYCDALRARHPHEVIYTYWDYQAGAWQRDHGVRIDHLLLSPEALDRLGAVGVDKAPRGLERPSDHTPIWCDLIF
jgi:exodeoxyribonuclease-3